MAQVSFNEIENNWNQNTNTNANTNSSNVGFFQLSDDGEEALVRFLHDDVNSFDILTYHGDQPVNGKKRKINCTRQSHEPTTNCPLCARGIPSSTSIFIHLIEYKKDENGNVVAEAKIWERGLSWARKLRDYINEYGPLSDSLFKIKRHGARGDAGTTYEVTYALPTVYKPELYPKNEALFNGYSVLGSIVMDKPADEINQYLATGSFPQKAAAPANGAPVSDPLPQTFTPQVEQVQVQPTNMVNPYGGNPNVTVVAQQPQRQAAWANNTNTQPVTAPKRYY